MMWEENCMRKKRITTGILTLFLLALSACNSEKEYDEMSNIIENVNEQETEQNETTTPNEDKDQKTGEIPTTPYPLEVQLDVDKELTEEESSYKIGEDYQYPYFSQSGVQIAKTEDGYYCLNNSFIYYIDGKTMKANPICSKAECMHETETEEERRIKCNAYTTSNQIQYYKGNLYVQETELLENNKNIEVFYRISSDGSTKEKLFQIKNINLSGWAVHRGYIYFTTAQYIPEKNEVDPGETQTYCRINRIPVDGAKKEEVVYECKEIKYNGEIYVPFLYKEHLYVEVFGTYEDRTAADVEDRKKLCFEKMLQYNIEDGTHSYIEADQESVVSAVNIFRGKLLFYGYHYEYDDKRNCQYYIADLDGSIRKKIFKTKEPSDRYITDGTYLYCDNYFGNFYSQMEGEKDANQAQYFQVYDMNLKGIDVVGLPEREGDAYYLSAQDANYFFETIDILEQDVSKANDIGFFDKGEIGTLKGSIWKKKSISILGE